MVQFRERGNGRAGVVDWTPAGVEQWAAMFEYQMGHQPSWVSLVITNQAHAALLLSNRWYYLYQIMFSVGG